MTQRMAVPASLRESPVMAVIRGGDPRYLIPVCETLLEAGIVHLEITTDTEEWQRAIVRFAAQPDAVVGAGTVLTAEHVARTFDAGGRYVVAPNTDAQVGEAAAAAGLAWYPGALTPTEIGRAWRLGATAVKVFPASAVGGASFIRAIRGPMSHIPVMPTGGVGVDDIPAYFSAGVIAVGMGSPLLGDALHGGSLTELSQRAKRVLEALHHE